MRIYIAIIVIAFGSVFAALHWIEIPTSHAIAVDSARETERIRLNREIAEAERDVADAKATLDVNLNVAGQMEGQTQSPEAITDELDSLNDAMSDLAKKKNHLRLLLNQQRQLTKQP